MIKLFGYDLGIDLGTSNLVISVPDKGVVLNEPSYVAYDTETEKMLYAGTYQVYVGTMQPDARSAELTGKTPVELLVNCAADQVLYDPEERKKNAK